jgi:DNA-binding IscR family transcriptional regulator
VVEAIDGPITLNECTQDPDICTFGDSCPLHEVWCETQTDLVRKLRDSTFDKLLKREDLKVK